MLEKRLVDVVVLLRQITFVCAEGIAGFFAGIGGIIGFDVGATSTTFWNMFVVVGFVVNGTVMI